MTVSIGSHHARAGRNFWRRINNGKVTISINHEKDENQYRYNRHSEFIFENGDIAEERIVLDNGHTRITRYGEYIKEINRKGKIVDLQKLMKGTNCAKVRTGNYRTKKCKLGSYRGTLKQSCYGGSMRREEFIYSNGQQAYSVYYGKKKGVVLYPNKKIWVEYEGTPVFAYKSEVFMGNTKEKGKYNLPVFENFNLESMRWRGEISIRGLFNSSNWSIKVYDQKGVIKYQAQQENRQNVGKWVKDYNPYYFLNGVECPAKLFEAKPEELDSAEIMAIKNIQLRTALATKKGYESILRDLNGKVIDTQGEYSLYELPITNPEERGDKVIKLLKVKCPSTGAYYTLRVHPDCVKVEQARQWTFGANLIEKEETVNEAIELLKET